MNVRVLPSARPLVASQDDLAAALRDWPDVSPVLLGGPFLVGGEVAVEAVGDAKVTLRGRAHATVRDRASVDARDGATVVAYDDAAVVARGRGVTVFASDRARVVAFGADVTVCAHASADVYRASEVQAWDDASVRAGSGCGVAATDRARVLVHAVEPARVCRRTEVAAAGEARIAIDDGAAFVSLHQASQLVIASGEVEVEVYGARAGVDGLGSLVRVTRYPRETSLAAELETLRAVRAQVVADVGQALDDGARSARARWPHDSGRD